MWVDTPRPVQLGILHSGGPFEDFDFDDNVAYCEHPVEQQPTCTMLYSPLQTINDHLGVELNYYGDPPPPPVFSVTIDGPGSGQPFDSVTVTAVVSNGAPPFNYEWTVNGSPACGNQSTCGARLGGEGTATSFSVTVTDAQSKTAFDDHVVNVPCQSEGCVERPVRFGATRP